MQELTMQVHPMLLACAEPLDSGVVRDILVELFEADGEDFAAKKCEEKLMDEDLCTVPELSNCTLADFRELGFNMGTSKRLVRIIFVLPAIQVTQPQQQLQASLPQTTSGSKSAPGFPEISPGASMAPAREVRAWLIGFRAYLRPRVEAGTMMDYDEMLKDLSAALLAPWDVASGESPQNEIVWTALVTAGQNGLPAALLLSLPQLVVSLRMGMAALQHFLRRALTVTDSGLGVHLDWFGEPGAASKLNLGHRLTQWEEVCELLNSNNAARGPLDCRQSLTKLTINCKELHPKLAALEVAHPTGVPVAVLLTACRAYADSVSSQRSALAETANLAEGFLVANSRPRASKPRQFTVPTGPEDPRWRTKPCKRWASGSCSFGDKCSFQHLGPAGTGPQNRVQSLEGQVALLTTALAEIKGLHQAASLAEGNLNQGGVKQGGLTPRKSLYRPVVASENVEFVQLHSNRSVAPNNSPNERDDREEGTLTNTNVPTHNQIGESYNGDPHNSKVDARVEVEKCKPIPNPSPNSMRTRRETILTRTKASYPKLYSLVPKRTPTHSDCPNASGEFPVIAQANNTHARSSNPSASSHIGDGAVGDSGASIVMVGRPHMKYVYNKRPLDKPIRLATAKGIITLEEQGDLAGFEGLMRGVALNNDSHHTLIPIIATCIKMDWSFGVSRGGKSAWFETGEGRVIWLEIENGLPMWYDDSYLFGSDSPNDIYSSLLASCEGIDSSELGWDPFEASSYSADSNLTPTEVYSVGGDTQLCHTCCLVYSEPKWMHNHDLNGHRPSHPKCPYCAQGTLRERKALRLSGHTRPPNTLSLAGDMSGPHEPGVYGSRWAFVGIEIMSKYGYVGLQDSKGASETLDSLKEFEREVVHLAPTVESL